MKAKYYDQALTYHNAGLKVIPFFRRDDGSVTFPTNYARYREAQSELDIKNLFNLPCDGIALLCTDGIEAIDIDIKHDPKKQIIHELTPLFERLEMPAVIQKTKSGGLHIIYRCPEPEGNMKLARREGCTEAMIETRGKGGLLFIAPSEGYQFLLGDITAIPHIEQEQRNELISLCRHLSAPEPITFTSPTPLAAPVTGVTPWQAYDDATDALDMMLSYGWTIVGKDKDFIRLNRPGAKHKRGIDGSVNTSENYFYPFSTSERFEANRGYSPSAIYTVMEHGGDFSAAAKDLYRQGYGDRMEQVKEEQEQKQGDALFLSMMQTKFDVTQAIEEKEPILNFYQHGQVYPIAGRGMIGVFTGHEKSGKSFVVGNIAASGVDFGGEHLNYSLDLQGGKMAYFDTEQSETFYRLTQRRVHRWAGEMRNIDRYAAFALRRFAPNERVNLIEKYIYQTPDLSVLIIDGFVDLLIDYNSLAEVQALVGRLMRWSDERNILILGVLHLNKGDGKVRGHIGSELKNKADFIINVAQPEDNQYIVTNPTARYRRAPTLEFSRTENGDPIYERSQVLRPVAGAEVSKDEIPF